MDVALIRKYAARVTGEAAFADLTREEDDSLDQVLLHKMAQAEDRVLLEYCQRLPGDAVQNYEALGGTFKKQAFGSPMFSAAPAPDPKLEAMSAATSPSSGSSGPKPPSPTSGPQGGGGSSTGAPKVQSIPEPGIPGSGASAGVGGGMG